MRSILPFELEAGRVIDGKFGSPRGSGPFGMFHIEYPRGKWILNVVASGACYESEGWEHVAVSMKHRCPDWDELCFVKNLFWMEEECVIQFHPPKSEYINFHPFCLHLWKPPFEVPLPPSILIGPK